MFYHADKLFKRAIIFYKVGKSLTASTVGKTESLEVAHNLEQRDFC